jgi:hypothetical protein
MESPAFEGHGIKIVMTGKKPKGKNKNFQVNPLKILLLKLQDF